MGLGGGGARASGRPRAEAARRRSGGGRRGDRRPPAPDGSTARAAAATLLDHVLHDRQPLDAALARSAGALAALEPRDAALVRALTRTALRHLGSIDHILDRLIEKPLPRKARFVRQVLRIGAAELLHMRTADHAAVATAVDVAKREAATAGFAGLVNAVLRRLQRERETLLAELPPAADTPPWLLARWAARYGAAEALAIARAHQAEPPLDLSVKDDPAGWAARLGGTLLPTGSIRLDTKAPVTELPGYAAGAWWVQDAAAALPVRLFGDLRGRRVADLCAAPGGKTAALCLAGAEVTAVDLSAERLARLAQNLDRLGLAADLVAADVLEWQPQRRFDAILLDAPCSSTGTIRRHPDVAWLKSERDVAALADLQARLVARAADWLVPGGTLVYATCSLEPEEGEAQVPRALAALPLTLSPIAPDELAGASRFVTVDGLLRTVPSGVLSADPPIAGLDGFFAARFRRR